MGYWIIAKNRWYYERDKILTRGTNPVQIEMNLARQRILGRKGFCMYALSFNVINYAIHWYINLSCHLTPTKCHSSVVKGDMFCICTTHSRSLDQHHPNPPNPQLPSRGPICPAKRTNVVVSYLMCLNFQHACSRFCSTITSLTSLESLHCPTLPLA